MNLHANETLHAAFKTYLRQHGLAYTRQRRCVLEQIAKGLAHFDIEELVALLRRKKTGVSRATAYRTVKYLERAKLVRKMDFDESHAHFEAASQENHHEHLICERCGAIVEFKDSRLEQRIRRMAADNGMVMTKHFVQIIGLCNKCSNKKAEM